MVLFALNWSLEVYNFFIAGLIMIISTFIMLREYLKVKRTFHLYLVLIWILLSIYMILGGFGILFQSKELYKWRNLLLFLSTFLLIQNFDTMYRSSLDPIKTLLFGITITGVIYYSFYPDSIISTTVLGHPSFQTSGIYAIWLTIFAVQLAILFVFYSLVIYINAPKSLKRKALMVVMAIGFFGLFFFISFILRLTKNIPGIIYLIIAIGAFMTGLSYKINPNLVKMLTTSGNKAKAKMIRRYLPICGKCNKIKDSKGKWHQIENYLSDHKDIGFTHSICPECQKKHYSEYLDD